MACDAYPRTMDAGALMSDTIINRLESESSDSTACMTGRPLRSRASSDSESSNAGGPISYLLSLPPW